MNGGQPAPHDSRLACRGLAMQIGIVNRVVSVEELDAKVARIASRIANLKAEMVVANKRLVISRGERTGFTTGFRILRRFAWSCG
jgi:enoyl-CoA hydratase/carnithine racemase